MTHLRQRSRPPVDPSSTIYSRQVWRAHGAGIVADDQAQQLHELIQRRRGAGHCGSCRPPARSCVRATSSSVRPSSDRRTGGLPSLRRREHAATDHCHRRIAQASPSGELAVLQGDLRRMAGPWRLRSQPQRTGGEGRGLPFAGQAGDQARRAGWPDHGAAPAAIGPQAPHQHHPHYPRRMARLAAPRAAARPMRSTPATGPSRSSRKLEGYKITRHGHRFFRNSGSDPVDKTVKKENRTGAGRA